MATYTLTYSGLTSPVTQAHIHFGKVHVAGRHHGLAVPDYRQRQPDAGTPFCPTAGGTVTGTIDGIECRRDIRDRT